METISIMIKPASGLCNMNCSYCFYCDEAVKRTQASFGMMSEETLRNVIRKTLTKVTGSYTLAFQGGEPTLRGLPFFEKAVALTKQYNRNQARVEFALQTNGFALTREWARFFAENHFLIGVSVDGLPEIHDRYRHPAGSGDHHDERAGDPSGSSGTYARVAEAIRLLEEYGVEYNILTVVHRETAENIKDIYREYRKKGWNYLQFIPCLDPLGEKPGQKEYSLLPETYGRFMIDLFQLWYEDYRKGNAPFIRQFQNYQRMMLGFRPEACDQRGRCGIQYVVEADGSVYPCDFYMLDEWKLGDFNKDSLDTIDRTRREKRFLERSAQYPAACRECEWFHLCRNGCYRCRTSLEGNQENAQGLINYFCQGYKMFFETCMDKMKKAAELSMK